jgi:hypothetical protein
VLLALLLSIVALVAPKQHITVAPAVSAASVRPGGHVSLFVDVMPDQGIHVYAPGAKGYEAIALKVDRPAGVTVGHTVYPESERMLFDGELIPVFQKPFRLGTTITVAKSAKPGAKIAVTGTVAYQACDDKVCFVPASLPVSWTVDVK